MLRVAICDDEIVFCSYIERIILNYAKKVAQKTEVDVFDSGNELCQYLRLGYQYDLLYLNVELEQGNGVEIGKWIRYTLKNNNIHIVYISSNSRYAMELFKIRPLDFMIKPFKEKDIQDTIKKVITLENKRGKNFIYKSRGVCKKIQVCDILYFSSDNREVEVHCKNYKERFYGSLISIYEELNRYGFFYCHQSYLVNYFQIIYFSKQELILSNQERIPISQGKRKQVRELQMSYENELEHTLT